MGGNMFKKKVFISYKRDVTPDEPLAEEIFTRLSKKHKVFLDQTIGTGGKWAKVIEKEIRNADYFVLLVSKNSVLSEMVIAEIEIALEANKAKGKPVILPVRLNYKDQLEYRLRAYLNSINYAFWRNKADTNKLIADLNAAILGNKFSQSKITIKKTKSQSTKSYSAPTPRASIVNLETPEGTMNSESKFYVKRDVDNIASSVIKKQGVTITIKGPRQMGKSSLLGFISNVAMKNKKKVVYLDFQLIEKKILANEDLFYPFFCRWVGSELGLLDNVQNYWDKSSLSGNIKLCTDYVRDQIIGRLKSPLVLAMDEVERMFDTSYRSDFFGMLRAWHNKRANDIVWKKLDLALVTSTEPYEFIADLNQSPFNVGEVIELHDFTFPQVVELNARHGKPLTPSNTQALMDLLNGHPYLTRKALYLVVTKQYSPLRLFSTAVKDDGPFGDHLRSHLFRLSSDEVLLGGFREIVLLNKSSNKNMLFRLRGAGLVKIDGDVVLPRNKLYSDYFSKSLYG